MAISRVKETSITTETRENQSRCDILRIDSWVEEGQNESCESSSRISQISGGFDEEIQLIELRSMRFSRLTWIFH